jgi:hypothetical protein
MGKEITWKWKCTGKEFRKNIKMFMKNGNVDV